MTGERFLNIAGSIASLAALGYLLTHLPRRGERATVAGLRGLPALVLDRTIGPLTFKMGRETKKDENYYTLVASDSSGKTVGEMTTITLPGVDAFVAGVTSMAERGSRVGTRMYEIMSEYMCREEGVPLSSDFSRTRQSENFWRKQYEKGRAKHTCYPAETGAEDSLDPTKGKACPPDERRYYDSSTYSQYHSKYRDQGIVSRYQIKACPAPTNLEGISGRRRARRKKGK